MQLCRAVIDCIGRYDSLPVSFGHKRTNRPAHRIRPLGSWFRAFDPLVIDIFVFILFFCLLVDPILGPFTWLECQKLIVRKEVERQIDAGIELDKLVLLQFAPEEVQTKLRWINYREFEYNDQLYDIVHIKIVDNMVNYWCWHDREETKLIKQIEELAFRALEKQGQSISDIARLIVSLRPLSYIFFSAWNIDRPGFLGKQDSWLHNLYISIFLSPPSPPPRFLG